MGAISPSDRLSRRTTNLGQAERSPDRRRARRGASALHRRTEEHLGELQRDLRKESDARPHHHCMTRPQMLEGLLDVGGEVVEAWDMQRLDGFLCRSFGL